MQKNNFFDDILLNQKNADIFQILTDLCAYLEDRKELTFNPILISGKTETGKSHIMALFKKWYPQKVHCLQCGDLLYQEQSKEELKKNFVLKPNKKMLILDDIQRLEENTYLQDQLVYFTEKLIPSIQILYLQNTDNMISLKKNCKSIINQGISFTLHEPDLDIKTRYTQKIIQDLDIKISKEQCLFIARKSSGFRNIQSIINHILLFRNHLGKMPSLQDIERITSKKGEIVTLNPDIIINTVAQHYGFTAKDIKGKKRYPRIAEARHVSIYLCRTLLGETYVEIGKIFGGKDHSTIVHSIKKIEELIVTNKVMHNLVTEVTRQCQKGLLSEK